MTLTQDKNRIFNEHYGGVGGLAKQQELWSAPVGVPLRQKS